MLVQVPVLVGTDATACNIQSTNARLVLMLMLSVRSSAGAVLVLV